MFKLHRASEQEWTAEVSLPDDFPYRDEAIIRAAVDKWFEDNWPAGVEGIGGADDFDLLEAVEEKLGLLREAPGKRVTEELYRSITGEFNIKAARKELRKMGASIRWSNGASYIPDRRWVPPTGE